MRFLATADWQLGMTRHFLDDDAQPRFNEARFDALTRIGEIARQEGCEFVAVGGDVFESNQVDRRTIERALARLRDIEVPVYLLPGNHDPLDGGSVFRRPEFTEGLPANVHVIETHDPITVADGVELVGAPWFSKRPGAEPTAAALAGLDPAPPGVTRVLVGHGGLDSFMDLEDGRMAIRAAGLEDALQRGVVHFAVLGDRHSTTDADIGGRVWYPGAPEPTRYTEKKPGYVLVVDAAAARAQVTEHQVGTWRFVEKRLELSSADDVAALEEWFEELRNEDRTIVKLRLFGQLDLGELNRVNRLVETKLARFAAIEERFGELHLAISAEAVEGLGLEGLARKTADELVALVQAEGEQAGTAADALALLGRLAGAKA